MPLLYHRFKRCGGLFFGVFRDRVRAHREGDDKAQTDESKKPQKKAKKRVAAILSVHSHRSVYNTGVRRFFIAVLIFPATTLAAAQAGFPSQSLWVSSQSANEGETIVVSSVVVNDAETEIRATLAFLANDARIGARAFELPSGKSQIHSIEWKPKKGEYVVNARIEGTSAELSQKETPPLSVVVKEPPAPPSEIEKTITQVVQTGSTLASSSAPFIIQTAQNIFAQTENWRNAGIEQLESYLASPSSSAPSEPPSRYLKNTLSNGMIAGTSTDSMSSMHSPQTGSGNGMLSNLAQTAAAGALFALKNAALFYPLLVVLILGTLYFLARRIRRQT
jgi:hypothetical protein